MTVARPTKALAWATDTNFTNGGVGIAGTPTKVEPSSPVKAEGHVPASPAPAQRLNWWQGIAGDWQSWYSALLGTDEELTYQTAKTRVFFQLPKPLYAVSWVYDQALDAGTLTTAVHSNILDLDLTEVLRTGQTINAIAVVMSAGHLDATSGHRMTLKLYKQNVGTGVKTQLGSTQTAPSSTAKETLAVAPAEVVDRATYIYFARIVASTTAGDGGLTDSVHMVEYSLQDLGPRNPV